MNGATAARVAAFDEEIGAEHRRRLQERRAADFDASRSK